MMLAKRRIERDARGEYVRIGTQIPGSLKEELFALLDSEGISFGFLVEAFIRGYVERSPAILALISQHQRERERDQTVSRRKAPVFSVNELDDIRRQLDGFSVLDDGGEEQEDAGTEDEED